MPHQEIIDSLKVCLVASLQKFHESNLCALTKEDYQALLTKMVVALDLQDRMLSYTFVTVSAWNLISCEILEHHRVLLLTPCEWQLMHSLSQRLPGGMQPKSGYLVIHVNLGHYKIDKLSPSDMVFSSQVHQHILGKIPMTHLNRCPPVLRGTMTIGSYLYKVLL
uniref:Uncharacterized protein n=1 Tax=Sphaerodactylus townsendi TaxID=933632 RepID=A0ACB8EX04_9SAUR